MLALVIASGIRHLTQTVNMAGGDLQGLLGRKALVPFGSDRVDIISGAAGSHLMYTCEWGGYQEGENWGQVTSQEPRIQPDIWPGL